MERHEQIEKSVLGSMLAEQYLIVDGEVKLDFFISQIHKNIFLMACKRYWQSNVPSTM